MKKYLKDNSKIYKAEMQTIPTISNSIKNKTLSDLSNDNIIIFPLDFIDSVDLTQDEMILEEKGEFYTTSNVMGFIGQKNEQLIISSRFGSTNNDYFLMYLLKKVLQIPNFIDLNLQGNENEYGNFLEFVFPFVLSKALRKGLFKSYLNFQENDSNIKGAIDISRHIKKNTPFVGKIAYNQRKFTYDNQLMELIRHTIEVIEGGPNGNLILSSIKENVQRIIDATHNYRSSQRNKIILYNQKHLIHHAYYSEYRELQQLCLLILQNKIHSVQKQSSKMYGFLFDGAWLWEEYINLIISDFFYHPGNKSHSGAQQLFTTNLGKAGLIYPDFIGKNLKNRLIADTKYKRIENINGRDYLQILAYMLRFESKKGMFIYPLINGNEILIFNLNSGSSFENFVGQQEGVSVQKLGFQIPTEADSYLTFEAKMHDSETKLQNIISDIELNE